MLAPRVSFFFALALPLAAAEPSRASLQSIREEAFRLSQSRDYSSALDKFHQLRLVALQNHKPDIAIQALNGVAGCHYGLFQYRDALKLYQQALGEANALRDADLAGIIATNIGSLYSSLGEAEKALDFVLRYPLDGQAIRREARLEWFVLQIQVFSRNRKTDQLSAAIERALRECLLPLPEKLAAADPALHRRWPEALAELRRAWLFDVVSDAYLELKQDRLAVAYAQDAYRIRATYQDPARLRSVIQLCILARRLGEFEEAWRMSETALRLEGSHPTPIQRFRLHRERGLILMRRGDPAAALRELRVALSFPRQWRAEVLPNDSTMLHFEQFLNGQIHQEFLQAVVDLPDHLVTPELAAEAFWVAEEARFSSLRAAFLPRDEVAKRLGKSYWPALRKFQELQTRILAGETSLRPDRDRLEIELSNLEISAGLSIPHAQTGSVSALATWRKSIPTDETVFAYFLSEPRSLAWAATKNGLEMKKIDGRTKIEKATKEYSGALRLEAWIKFSSIGNGLTKQLFGEFSYAYRTNPFWTVVIDDPLGGIPMSALPALENSRQYLAESHTIRWLPSASFLGRSRAGAWQLQASAFSDPIYNFADERLARTGSSKPDSNSFQLNRLPASSSEVRTAFGSLSKANWTTRTAAGTDANPGNLRLETSHSPDILHIASHFSADRSRPDLLAISLSSTTKPGQIDLFSSQDLSTLRTSAKLVVLSGCASHSGAAYPGLGIVGLSRGWLVSGAENVLGTLWPVEDLAGPFFAEYYSRLAALPYGSRSISTALRETQIRMMRRQDRYAAPRYWAAYALLQRS